MIDHITSPLYVSALKGEDVECIHSQDQCRLVVY